LIVRRVTAENIRHTIEDMSRFGRDTEEGVTRLAFSDSDIAAREYLRKRFESLDLIVTVDQIGNLFARRNGRNNKLAVLGIGSHTDSVPNGGKFDGVAGIAVALEVLRILNERKYESNQPIELVVLAAEEGSRFPIFLGSKVMTGLMSLEDAYRFEDANGTSVKEAVTKTLGSEHAESARKPVGYFTAWIEPHVEQGSVLEQHGCNLGIVTKIVGIQQLHVAFGGGSGHAGTPMNLRRDPMVAAATLIAELPRIASRVSSHLVVTVGALKVTPGASNVIPRIAEFVMDFRDFELDGMERFRRVMNQRASEIAENLNVSYSIREISKSSPTPMDETLIDLIEDTANSLALRTMRIVSRAGHDTQNISRIARCGMIFAPSKGGISHAPSEFTDWRQLTDVTDVLLHVVQNLSIGGQLGFS